MRIHLKLPRLGRPSIGLILFLIVIAGFLLRVWGLSSVYQRVDDFPVAKQISYVYQGNFEPDPLLFYPIFFNYIVGILLRILSWFLAVLGIHQGPGLYPFTMDEILFIARLVSATMGALTILVVFKIGKTLFSERTGLTAAFFFSLSFVHILYSHQIVLDVPMTLFYALSLYFCALILKEGRWGPYLAAAFFAGLATATKYNGLFVVFSILAAHIWKKAETQKNILKILFDKKIIGAAFVSLASFLAGHPYAVLWYKSFLKATATLAKLVHETEWYLVWIKPRTLIEKIAETKYVKGFGNILAAEGLAFFILVLFGVASLLIKRKREKAFIGLSGLIYFAGALGFLGFSRLRDLSTLAVFYAFFAAFGLTLFPELLKRGRASRTAFAVLAAASVVFFGFRALGRAYYLHENDTTEIAERWMRTNCPPGGAVGREWFTPELRDPAPRFRIFTKPWLVRDFPPFDQFDYVLASSANYGFFYKYAKYYPDQVAIYERLKNRNELLKNFFFEEIEFKNPDVAVYSGKVARRAKARLALPSLPVEPHPAREFDIADGSPYGKDVKCFFLASGERIERIFVNRKPITRWGVFIQNPGGDGEVTLRSGFHQRRYPVRRGRDAFIIFGSRRAFPFFRYLSKLRIRASDRLGSCFVKICQDDFEIASELFRMGDFVRAREFFVEARQNPPAQARDAEILLYLACCARMTGRADEERRYLDQFAETHPEAERLRALVQALDKGDAWAGEFEDYSGIDLSLYASTMSVLVDDDQFTFEHGAELKSDSFVNRKAWVTLPGSGGEALSGLSQPRKLPPLAYRAEFFFDNPRKTEGIIGEAEVIVRKEGGEEARSFPLRAEAAEEDRGSKAVIQFAVAPSSGEILFRLKLAKGTDVAFDYMKILPDLGAWLRAQYSLFRDYLKSP